jgi:hypothetical protein
MKSSTLTATAIFASSALAAKYPAGTNCHSNVECNNNCVNSEFTIINLDGGYIFACDANSPNPTQWYSLGCKTRYDPRGESDGDTDEEVTDAACEAVGGLNCYSRCVMSSKRSADEDLRKEWQDNCGKDKNGYQTEPYIYVERSEATAKIGCP